MRGKIKLVLGALAIVAMALLFYGLVAGKNVAIWQPAGEIGRRQKELIIVALALSSVVVIPVYALTIGILWRYREANNRAKYAPEWDSHVGLEIVWWGVPAILIIVLSVITWRTSHSLDPFRSIDSNTKPLKVQVVALQWKWLFIYPEQGLATVNYLKVPEDTPLNFEITADAPMNSFWIPNLGTQIYAMNGMVTKVHLIADESGEYPGYSANISGEGFANMRFVLSSTDRASFDKWVDDVTASDSLFDHTEYVALHEPSIVSTPKQYSYVAGDIFDHVLSQYKTVGHAHTHEDYDL